LRGTTVLHNVPRSFLHALMKKRLSPSLLLLPLLLSVARVRMVGRRRGEALDDCCIRGRNGMHRAATGAAKARCAIDLDSISSVCVVV
jgi:hypothetical protein